MTVVSPERAKHGYLLGGDEGEAFWLLGMLEIIKISGADTDGEYGLIEVTVRAGEGSPWHVHPEEDEWFYVLDGDVSFHVGDETYRCTSGAFVSFPQGIPHTFTIESPSARILVLNTPGGFERMFELAPKSPEEAQRALAEYGVEIVGPHPRGTT